MGASRVRSRTARAAGDPSRVAQGGLPGSASTPASTHLTSKQLMLTEHVPPGAERRQGRRECTTQLLRPARRGGR
jgi:hypothetical protein